MPSTRRFVSARAHAARTERRHGVCPLSGATVTLASSGSNDTLTQPGPTDSTGTATGTISSTTAETKTVAASVVPLSGGAPAALGAQPTVAFQ